jgi:hypothetical protein
MPAGRRSWWNGRGLARRDGRVRYGLIRILPWLTALSRWALQKSATANGFVTGQYALGTEQGIR